MGEGQAAEPLQGKCLALMGKGRVLCLSERYNHVPPNQ